MVAQPAEREDDPRPDPSSGWFVQGLYARVTGRIPVGSADRALQVAWVLAGMLLGAAVSLVFRWSVLELAVTVVAVGALSWLGKGLSTVLLATTVTLAGLAGVYRTTMIVFPHQSWSMRWLAPLSVVLVVLAVLLARRLEVAAWQGSRLAAGLVDLASGSGALVVSAVCYHRMASNLAAAILVTSEDNDAWLNTIGTLHDAHGVTAATATQVPQFGPVIGLFLSYIRSATGGLLPVKVLASDTATAVVAAHMLLAVTCPVVAGLLARRTLRHGRPVLSLLTWVVTAAVLDAYALTMPIYGFLSATLAVLLVLTAAYLVPSRRTDFGQPRQTVGWLAAAALIYAAGSSWVPLVPLAGLALFVWYAGALLQSLWHGPWSRVRLLAILGVPTVLLGLALVNQYRDVTDQTGGSGILFIAGGRTPVASEIMIAATFVVIALSWLTNNLAAGRGRRLLPSFSTPLVWIVIYLVAILLDEAWVTKTAPHYGSVKLLYVVVGLALVLGFVDLMASDAVGTRRLDVAAAVAAAVLFAATAGVGPLYDAAAAHWPSPGVMPPWVAVVTNAVAGNERVMCLGTTPARDPNGVNLAAYTCSRFASSLQGRDDLTALTWRFVQLNRQPVSDAVKALRNAKDRPWKIVVVGSMAGLHSPTAWWAPILKEGGLTFVQGGPGDIIAPSSATASSSGTAPSSGDASLDSRITRNAQVTDSAGNIYIKGYDAAGNVLKSTLIGHVAASAPPPAVGARP